jgi:hypothetical protein
MRICVGWKGIFIYFEECQGILLKLIYREFIQPTEAYHGGL